MTTKHCPRCDQTKELEDFPSKGSRRHSCWCRVCENAYKRDRRRGRVPVAACSWPGCDRPREAKELCGAHYKRQKRGTKMDRPVWTPNRNAESELGEAGLAYADAEFEEAPVKFRALTVAAVSYVNWLRSVKRRKKAA